MTFQGSHLAIGVRKGLAIADTDTGNVNLIPLPGPYHYIQAIA